MYGKTKTNRVWNAALFFCLLNTCMCCLEMNGFDYSCGTPRWAPQPSLYTISTLPISTYSIFSSEISLELYNDLQSNKSKRMNLNTKMKDFHLRNIKTMEKTLEIFEGTSRSLTVGLWLQSEGQDPSYPNLVVTLVARSGSECGSGSGGAEVYRSSQGWERIRLL